VNRLYQLSAIEVKDDTEITDCQCFCVGENEQDAADIAGHCDAHSPHWNACEVCLIATAEDKTGQTHRVLLLPDLSEEAKNVEKSGL
jgi:hypothetical protein